MPSSSYPHAKFETTRWSMIAEAALEMNASQGGSHAREALQRLCEIYWYPIYSFIRRRGQTPDRAEDITQGFFTQLLEKGSLAQADPARGRFRTFLLAALKNFMSHEKAHRQALKRGGRRGHLSLSLDQAEQRFALEPVDGWTPEAIFDRNWALSLLREVLQSLEADYVNSGKGELFAALRPHLTGHPPHQTLAESAVRLQMTTGAVKVAAHRLRADYRLKLCAAVADTVSAESEIDAERTLLLNAIAGT